MKVALQVGLLLFAGWQTTALAQSDEDNFRRGRPDIRSFSALTFAPEGILFVGDSKGGAVYALDLHDKIERPGEDRVNLPDVELRIAAALGTKAEDVLIHDLAVNPISQNIYLSVSRGRGNLNQRWLLPNDVADAGILVRIAPDGNIFEADLKNVLYARADLPNPVADGKTHRWKEGISLRADTVTDIVYADGRLFVAGLSNEEFASTMWQIPYPFSEKAVASTLEIYHGAHGAYETHAPIRSFLPFTLNGTPHLVAAYLCTPLVTFPVADLKDGQHIKGRTVAEFGSGNYPLDMVRYQKDGQDFILIANSNLPLMIVDPRDVESYQGAITNRVSEYTAGVKNSYRSGTGIEQLDKLNSAWVVALQRGPNGKLDLVSFPFRRF